MGLDRNIHLEPFIKIKNQYVSKNVKVKSCKNHGENHSDDKFCKECGSPIVEKEIKKQYRLWYCDLTGNENLWEHEENGYTYLMSNKTNVCDKFSKPYKNEMIPLTQKDIDSLIEEFKEYHKSDIEVLEQKLNIEIEVYFGLLYHVW